MKSFKKLFTSIILVLILALIVTGCSNASDKKRNIGSESESGSESGSESASVPQGFVYLNEVIPNAEYDIRYFREHNFVGRQIDGYLAPKAIMTTQAATALKNVQQDLKEQGFGLKIYDAYRPKRAVEDFVQWAGDPNDTKMKEEFYPNIDKSELFDQGYIAQKSGHSRGSTVDLSLVDYDTKNDIDMGGHFDLLDPISQHDSPAITEEQRRNRNLLKSVMEKNGFKSYYKEWWHYSLDKEPYRNKYFDFLVQ